MARPKKYNSEAERKAEYNRRKRVARQQESAEKRAKRLQRDAKAKREKHETEKQRAARLGRDAEMHRLRTERETDEQRRVRLQRHAELERKRIENETVEQRALRLQRDAEAHRMRRVYETPKHRAERLQRDAEAHRRRIRASLLTNAINSVSEDQISVGEHHCDPINEKCRLCKSLNFKVEKPTEKTFTARCHKDSNNEEVDDKPEIDVKLYTHCQLLCKELPVQKIQKFDPQPEAVTSLTQKEVSACFVCKYCDTLFLDSVRFHSHLVVDHGKTAFATLQK